MSESAYLEHTDLDSAGRKAGLAELQETHQAASDAMIDVVLGCRIPDTAVRLSLLASDAGHNDGLMQAGIAPRKPTSDATKRAVAQINALKPGDTEALRAIVASLPDR